MSDVRKHATLGGVILGSLLALLLAASAHAQVTQDFHRTVPLSANGRVSLDNVNGNVEITGCDRNEVQIDAVKKARDQQRLDEARIDVNAASDSVEIKTRYPEGHTNNNPGLWALPTPRAAECAPRSYQPGERFAQRAESQRRGECQHGERQAAG